jgi:hypothetical protein
VVDSSNTRWNKAAKAYLDEISTQLLSTAKAPCESYTLQDFLECSKNKLRTYTSQNLTCIIFQFSEFFNSRNSDLPHCTNETDASKNFKLFGSDVLYFVNNINSFCPLPCITQSYSHIIEYFSKFTWIENVSNMVDINQDVFEFTIAYNQFYTEVRMEALVYDIGNLLVAAGGNLGLFMGFSCLSILLTGISHFFKYLK